MLTGLGFAQRAHRHCGRRTKSVALVVQQLPDPIDNVIKHMRPQPDECVGDGHPSPHVGVQQEAHQSSSVPGSRGPELPEGADGLDPHQRHVQICDHALELGAANSTECAHSRKRGFPDKHLRICQQPAQQPEALHHSQSTQAAGGRCPDLPLLGNHQFLQCCCGLPGITCPNGGHSPHGLLSDGQARIRPRQSQDMRKQFSSSTARFGNCRDSAQADLGVGAGQVLSKIAQRTFVQLCKLNRQGRHGSGYATLQLPNHLSPNSHT
mmetsp:Transcript_82342/g.266623  ORF Transcript_82342/g.266623 Transcript_82342/m.266623 type:complete len:266 (+) Transcript_82342:393-1190(+)